MVHNSHAGIALHPPTFNPPIDRDALDDGPLGQINVPPSRPGGLWRVITVAMRCPVCGSVSSKACTGKRVNSAGLFEHYRVCRDCRLRFRVTQE